MFTGLISAVGTVTAADHSDDGLELEIEALRDGFEMRRLVRRGIPFRTPTYTVEDDLIWGATARILHDLLERLEGLA